MKLSLSIDRFEGKLAVLLADDGTLIDFPRKLLPKGAKAGDVLSLTIDLDAAAIKAVIDQTRKVQDELQQRDPGGDLKL